MAILRYFQSRLFPNSETPLDAIPNLSIGGWGGWHYAVGSSMMIHNAVGQQITTYCIFDRDYHTPSEIEERYRQAEQKGVQLHVWQRKELENYLINAPVIQRLLGARYNGPSVAPSLAEVNAAMLSIAAEIKDVTCMEVATSLQAEDHKLTAMTAMQRARAVVEGSWHEPLGRLAVVSGKEMLARLSQWSQGACGVTFGAPALARQFKADEIPSEVTSVLSAIDMCEPFPPLAATVRGS